MERSLALWFVADYKCWPHSSFVNTIVILCSEIIFLPTTNKVLLRLYGMIYIWYKQETDNAYSQIFINDVA